VRLEGASLGKAGAVVTDLGQDPPTTVVRVARLQRASTASESLVLLRIIVISRSKQKPARVMHDDVDGTIDRCVFDAHSTRQIR
jgi:hypothetical protein